MHKKIIVSFLFIAFFLTIVPSAFADKVLFFTPTRVNLNEQDKIEVMNITNLSKITRAYKISFQDLVMTPEGITAPVDNFEYSAKRMLRFVPREFTLKPGERQTVRIMARIGSNVAEGDYHTHVRFLEDVTKRDELNPIDPNSRQAAIAAPLAYEALIPATVTKGNINVALDMNNLRLQRNANGSLKAIMNITRSGNGQGIARIATTYTPPNGKEVSVTPRRTVYIYRELNQRTKDYDFSIPADLPQGGTLKFSLYDSDDAGAKPIKVLTAPLS